MNSIMLHQNQNPGKQKTQSSLAPRVKSSIQGECSYIVATLEHRRELLADWLPSISLQQLPDPKAQRTLALNVLKVCSTMLYRNTKNKGSPTTIDQLMSLIILQNSRHSHLLRSMMANTDCRLDGVKNHLGDACL